MQVTAPTGRVHDVRRRWLAWRQRIPLDTELVITLLAAVELALRVLLAPLAVLLRMLRILPWVIEVRDVGARPGRAVVAREGVRGWGPSEERIQAWARELEDGTAGADGPDFSVVITRDSVAAGDDVDDNTTVVTLDDRTAEPTLETLLTALQRRGRFISVQGSPTTWALREGGVSGRPLAVFVVDRDRPSLDLHPVGDTSFRVARDGRFHLEYLLTQSVERTLELIAASPRGKRSLRDDRQA